MSCWHQRGIGAAPLAVGGKGWDSPCHGPCWPSEGQGDSQRLVAQWELGQHQSWGKRPPFLTIPQPLPLSPCSISHCLSFSAFPAHSRFQLWCFPGKPGCWQTGWLSAGLAPAKDWLGLRAKAGPGAGLASHLGAAAHPKGSRSPGYHLCPG